MTIYIRMTENGGESQNSHKMLNFCKACGQILEEGNVLNLVSRHTHDLQRAAQMGTGGERWQYIISAVAFATYKWIVE